MFLPENIDLGHSKNYILTIRIEKKRFLFSIYNPNDKKIFCLRETSFSNKQSLLNNIQRIVFDFNFLTQQYLKTNVIFASSNYTVVPSEYCVDKEKHKLFNFVRTMEDEQVLSNEHNDYNFLYGVDKSVYDFLIRSLFAPDFYHHAYLLFTYLGKEFVTKNIGISSMFVNAYDNIVDLLCFTNSGLLHSLTYEYESMVNVQYYILKLWETCGFNQQSDVLFKLGEFDTNFDDTLLQYIQNIKQLTTPPEIHFFGEEAHRAPFDLLVLAL